MDDRFARLEGQTVKVEELSVQRARELAGLLSVGVIEYAEFVECRRIGERECVVLDVEVELGQRRVHPIERTERIAVTFDPADQLMPEVLALRLDFPVVPHLNLRSVEIPRSLCIYSQSFRDLKRSWTAPRFVEDVRSWLARTAKGTLHDDDQALEPILLSHHGHIILPRGLFVPEATERSTYLSLQATRLEPGQYLFIAQRGQDMGDDERGQPFIVSVHECAAQEHGVIRRTPENLEELAELVGGAGLDIRQELWERISRWKDEVGKGEKRFLDAWLTLVIAFPKMRRLGGEVEASDVWAFLLPKSVREIGIDLGVWTFIEGGLGREPVRLPERTGAKVPAMLLNPVFGLTRRSAARLSGFETVNDTRAVAVGSGALGSHVIMNLARCGFGRWTVVDADVLLPHNLVRHTLSGPAVGWPKADAVAANAESVTQDSGSFAAIEVDVLSPGDQAARLADALRDAEIILDMSASVAVARHLASLDGTARRVSTFLNPSGEDLVLLAEDRGRHAPLDVLEMQYYRALLHREDLRGHFIGGEQRLRYGQACRDLTSRIPEECFGLHGAIASRALRKVVSDDSARILVWRAEADFNVSRVEVEVSAVGRCAIGEWTLYLDTWVLAELGRLRASKLPNETGGVLVGSFDLERKNVYLADVVPSPPDSQEWPMLYIRGCRGLKKEIDRITSQTDGALQYIGEWHTHPDGCSTAPSDDDMKVFGWLTEVMSREGLPSVMMIVGAQGSVSCFIGRIASQENLVPPIEP